MHLTKSDAQRRSCMGGAMHLVENCSCSAKGLVPGCLLHIVRLPIHFVGVCFALLFLTQNLLLPRLSLKYKIYPRMVLNSGLSCFQHQVLTLQVCATKHGLLFC